MKSLYCSLQIILLVSMLWCTANSFSKTIEDWRTCYEKSGFVETSRYLETISYFQRLDRASIYAKLTFLGKSPEGRDLPLFIISKDQAFTPTTASKTAKPIILIQACIHAGESEGKDAAMILARELLIENKFTKILNNLIILIIPIFNVDGHERFSAYNRINQNGPKQMGWRVTGNRLNLNRDFMKADAPEMRYWLDMYHQWLPHFFYDCHTTDGADFQYVLNYNIDEHPSFGGAVSCWAHDDFLPAVQKRCDDAGMIIGLYAEPVDEFSPEKGFKGGVWRPMLSNVYATICNRAGFLIETHSLKPYRTRVDATLDFIVFGLEEIARDPEKLIHAITIEDSAMMEIGEQNDTAVQFPLQFQLSSDPGTPMLHRGYRFSLQRGNLSGADYPIFQPQPVDIPSVYLNKVVPTISIVPPVGYLISPAWANVLAVLKAHHIIFQSTKKEMILECEGYRFSDVKFRSSSYEGRQIPSFDVISIKEKQSFPAGTIYIPLGCRKSRLIINLLEPQAMDALVTWGLFNTIFEDREYFEEYVMEPLAEKMMVENPELEREFRQKLASDSAFAISPRARLNFFYERTPYYDREKNLYPVFRMMEKIEKEALSDERVK